MPFKSNMSNLQPRRQQFSRRIKLLSGGYVKPDAFPNGEIMVFPWDSSVDEWLANRLKTGSRDTALYDLCAQVCDLNGCPLDSFLLGDVNTVLLVARSIRYNSVVEYESECRHCGHRRIETIKVPDELERVGEKGPDYQGFDEITLPECKDVVAVRPLHIRDEKTILERDDTTKALMTERVHRVLMAVVSINNGKPDCWEDALRWYNALSPVDMADLERKENELYPHLETTIWHQCDACGKKFTFDLDLNDVEFFRASLKSGPRGTVAATVQPSVVGQGAIHKPVGSSGPSAGADGGMGKSEDRRGKRAN